MAWKFGSVTTSLWEYAEFYIEALVAIMVAWGCFIFIYRHKRRRLLPPGPFPLPVLGNLHLLGNLPHQALAELSLKYGPLMSLRLGSSALTLVLSSGEIAGEFLKGHDRLFAGRPSSAAIKFLSYNSSDVAFAPYGPYWRQMRKVCVLQLLSSKRIDSFSSIREEEVSAMILSIINSDSDHPQDDPRPLNISKTVSALTNAIICKMVFGRKYSDEDLIGSTGFDSLDMLVAGMDTSSTSIEWAMSEVLRNPKLLQKLLDELESVVGMDRMVRESDLTRLVYLQAVVKETLRLHPAGPFAIHSAVEDCTVLGYEIPRNTLIFFNLWAIGRNPKSWGEDAQSFKPERFLAQAEAGLIHKAHENFDWLPFGAGRRGCPGQPLATLVVEFVVGQLLHCFKWRLPVNGKELDMTEKFNGLTLLRAHELLAFPTPRPPVL